MKLAISALLVGAATAFVPSQPKATFNTALAATRAVTATKKAAPKPAPVASKAVGADPNVYGLLGALPPVGFFDPLGLSKGKDEETILKWRENEVMHGRFAMLAFLGFVTPEKAAQGANWGDEYLAPGGTALDALQSTPSLVYLTLGLISGLELLRLIETTPGARTDGKTEGIGWRPSDPDRFNEMVVRELQNGRLAMLAVAGIVAQELVNGKPVLVNLQDNNFVSF